MAKEHQEVKKPERNYDQEYFDFIKNSVDDGSYFKDALNWYFFRYISPICDRTMLIIGGLVSVVILYFLIEMIDMAFPLIIREPLFIKAKDSSVYYPNLVRLKPKKGMQGYDQNLRSVDEAVLKYILSYYVKEREGYDFRKGEIEVVNNKFNHIINLSSTIEYEAFQNFMSKNNPESPILNFGKNIEKKIFIDSVSFVRKEPKNLVEKFDEYISNKIPTDAEVRFTAVITSISDYGEKTTEKQRYLAKINFLSPGIQNDQNKKSANVNSYQNEQAGQVKFIVNRYKLYKIK